MKILIVTNLYPLPWEPNRAMFNKQQFDRLQKTDELKIIVPVAWTAYFKHKNKIKNTDNVRYVCFWYIPKIMHGLLGVFMYVSVLLGAGRWIRGNSFDAVIGSWAFPEGYVAKKISERIGKPYFVKVHGSDINLLSPKSARSYLTSQVCKSANHVFTPSNALKDKVVGLGVNPERVSRIYNGVDDNLFYLEEIISKEQYILFVGNLKKEKGVFELLTAFSRYAEAGRKLKLKYVGDGAMFRQLQIMVSSLELEDKVEFLGAKPHQKVASYIRNCRCLVLPSYSEGVPNVLLEAAKSGVPVIATKVGGIPEVVLPDKTGILVEPRDTESLSRALIKFENDVWDKKFIANYGLNFCWDKNVKTFKRLLENS